MKMIFHAYVLTILWQIELGVLRALLAHLDLSICMLFLAVGVGLAHFYAACVHIAFD